MIRVDPSPILFYFYFFIRSELVRVDPTRTGGPSWSGPTFVPASSIHIFPNLTTVDIYSHSSMQDSCHLYMG